MLEGNRFHLPSKYFCWSWTREGDGCFQPFHVVFSVDLPPSGGDSTAPLRRFYLFSPVILCILFKCVLWREGLIMFLGGMWVMFVT